MIYEESYGTIPLKKQKDKWFTFLIKNKSGNHWGFPKGRANLSETPKKAAERELQEEANLKIIRYLYPNPIIEQYQLVRNSQKITKKVYYYLVEVEGVGKITSDEILDGKWIEITKAKQEVTYEQSKLIANQVEIILKSL
jgi:8-oxo-dGTP pyrophosphatase MutT (NUDIX family)